MSIPTTATQQPEDFENVHQIVVPLLVRSLQSLSTLLRMRSNSLPRPTGPREGLVLARPSHTLHPLLTGASQWVPRTYQALSHFRVSAWDTRPLSFLTWLFFPVTFQVLAVNIISSEGLFQETLSNSLQQSLPLYPVCFCQHSHHSCSHARLTSTRSGVCLSHTALHTARCRDHSTVFTTAAPASGTVSGTLLALDK